MTVNEAKKIMLAAPLNPTERLALHVLLSEIDRYSESLPNEIWRDIREFEGYYQISNFGRIKSFQKGKVRIINTELSKGYLRAVLRVCSHY